MSTTCQQLYVRARQSSPANANLTLRPEEILARVEADQQALFVTLATISRDRFQTTASLTSTSGASRRAFDLAGLSPACERVLQLTLSDGREAHQVDVLDVDAELSPRYIVRGRTLVEVSNDWRVGTGSVTASLVYVYGPTAIVANTDLTQSISVPDEWADLLVLPLRQYLAQLRPAAPGDDLIAAQLADRTKAFTAYLTNFGGIASTRFNIPTPIVGGNPKQ